MTYKIMNKKLKKIIDEIDTHNHMIRRKLSQGSENIYDQHVWSVSLYYSFIGHLKNIVVILDNPKNLSGIFSLFRSSLDCYINFINVALNYHQYKEYEKDKLSQTTRLISRIDFNSHTTTQNRELLKALSHHVEMLKQLDGIKRTYLREKTKRTNINLPEIISHFYDLCSEHSHVGHNSLRQYHINKKNNLYYPEQPPIPPIINVLWSIGILIGMLQEVTVRVTSDTGFNLNKHNLKKVIQAIKLCDTYILKQLKKYKYPFVE